jgi:hypothetical protein
MHKRAKLMSTATHADADPTASNANANADAPLSYRKELYNLFQGNKKVFTFATGGELPASMDTPIIRFPNTAIGRLAYPINKLQADELIKLAQPAPFGKGTETLLDNHVRQAWQVDTARFLVDERWVNEALPKLVADVTQEFGIDPPCRVEAHLYKMLLYEEGGHFLRHKDTEKEEGMFGTLLVQLPAEHQGGELIVEHLQWKKQFAFDKESAEKSFFSAFYADCDHILLPITSGYRLVLAYNLVCVNGMSLQLQDVASEELEKVRSATKLWHDEVVSQTTKELMIPLEHTYSMANLNFQRLKGNDRGVVNMIRSCYDEEGKPLFKVYLVIMVKYARAYQDDVGRIKCSTDVWADENGIVKPSAGKELKLNFPSCVLLDDEEHEPNEDDEYYYRGGCEFNEYFKVYEVTEQHEGYQGNDGGYSEYWYRSAYVAFWPSKLDA